MTKNFFEIFGIPDINAPQIKSFRFIEDSIDISSGNGVVETEIELTDDLSGVKHAFSYWKSPSGNQVTFFSNLVSGDSTSGKYKSSFNLNEFSEPGLWSLNRLHLSDEVNNKTNYYPDDFSEIVLHHENNAIGSISLDLIQKDTFRKTRIIFENAEVEIDFVSKKNNLTPVNAEIFSIYVIGLHCPEII